MTDDATQRWLHPLIQMMYSAGLDERLYDFYEKATFDSCVEALPEMGSAGLLQLAR